MPLHRSLAVPALLITAACGSVAGKSSESAADAAVVDAAPAARAYAGTTPSVTPVMFGPTACQYTITLRQVELDLAILPSGQVTGGTAQALNIETTVAPCTNTPIGPNIATYTLTSAAAAQAGMMLSFAGASTNGPHADLAVTLSASGTAYKAHLIFHRNDITAPYDWKVETDVTLAAK